MIFLTSQCEKRIEGTVRVGAVCGRAQTLSSLVSLKDRQQAQHRALLWEALSLAHSISLGNLWPSPTLLPPGAAAAPPRYVHMAQAGSHWGTPGKV